MADTNTWTPIDDPTAFNDDAVFLIDDKTKIIQVLVEQPIVAGENKSQFIKFQMGRYYDAIDLIQMEVNILYESPTGYQDISSAVNREYSDEYIRFGWLVPYAACPEKGTLSFAVEFVGEDYVLKTTRGSTPVLDSIAGSSSVPEPVEQTWYIELQSQVAAAINNANSTMESVREYIDTFQGNIDDAIDNWFDTHPEAITTVQDGAVTTAKLASGSVTEAKLASDSVSSDKVQDGAISEAKLAEALLLKTIKGYVTPQMYGAVGDGVTDDTVAIKSAMASGADVFFPGGNYLVSFDGDGDFIFKFNANQTVVMSGDAYIIVNANSYTHYRVMSFDANSTGAKLFGGNIVGDKDTHTYTSESTHEYCHAISVSDSANVVIKDVNISDMPGDGVNIGGSGENKNASNITVNSVTIDHCRRQGISICGGKNVIITDCRISNIGGTPPQSGIDIEPWANGQVSEGIVISNCIIETCQGRGVLLASSIESPIVQVTICNIVMKNLSRGCIEITDGTGEGSAVVGTGSEGVVNVSNIIADGLGFPAVLVVNHPNTSYRVNVDNIVAKNINTGSNGNDYNAVISVITNNSYSAGVPVGNVYVKNVTPISGNYRRYLWMIASQIIKNVTIDLPGYIYTGMKNASNPQNELLVNSDAKDVVFNDPYHVSVYEYDTYYKATIPINRWYSRRIVTEDVTQDYTFSFNNDDDAFFEFDVEIINMNPNHNVIINADFVNHTGALTLGYCERATVKRLKSVRKELLVSTTAIFNNS